MKTHAAFSIVVAAFGLLFAVAGQVAAEPPHVSYIFPAGAQRGTRVTTRVGGHYLHERANFEISGPGVEGPTSIARTETIWFEGPLLRQPASQRAEDYPKDYAAPLEIAADAPLGPRVWRVWTSQGMTAGRKFVVGDLPEVVEEETDGEPLPVAVRLPVTVNGRIFPREDVDLWTFQATAGKPIVCSVAALSLGSPLEARLELRDAGGALLAEATSVGRNDPVIRFTPAESGEFQLRIHDVKFDGLQPYVYRLTITDQPWIDAIYPLGGRRGAEVTCETTGDGAVQRRVVRIAQDAPAVFEQRFSPSGTKASGGYASNPLAMAADDLPEALESEPNANDDQAATLVVPSVGNGRIGEPGDRDVWKFAATKGTPIQFELQAALLGSSLQAVIVVRNAAGQDVVRADGLNFPSGDPTVTFVPSADGDYFVEVTDRFAARGGSSAAYRLKLRPQSPGARLELATEVVMAGRGKPQKLSVTVVRDGGFKAPVTVSVEGLPDDVRAAEQVFPPNKTKGDLVFEAAETAKVSRHPIRVIGKYESEGETRTTTATLVAAAPGSPAAAAPGAAGESGERPIWLAVTMPTPFRFTAEFGLPFAPLGSLFRKRYLIERNGYEGPLEVALADRQTRHLQGVTGPTVAVPAGQDEFVYAITLSPRMQLGRTCRVVPMLVGEVADEQGVRHKVCYTTADQACQLANILAPAPIRVVLDRSSVLATPGGQTTLPVQIRRDPQNRAPVRVELIVPSHMRDIQAEPVTVDGDATEATLVLRFGASPGPFNMPLSVRAVGRLNDDPLTTETTFECVRAE